MRRSLLALSSVSLLFACGDVVGDGSENANGTPTNSTTCGDGACGVTESAATCPADCTPVLSGGLIVDHTAVQAFDTIPAQWLDAAKALTFHYAHTSHGSQILSGLGALESRSATYSIAVRENSTEGLPPAETPAALRIYDGNAGATYITPDLYWESSTGLARTASVAATGNYDFSMWSWCGQASSYSETQIQNYLTAMDDLEDDHPGMRFILMTGHNDGAATAIVRNNNLIRAYARSNGKVLFDFQDIETHDPEGGAQPDVTTESCGWCASWCSAHSSHPDCQASVSCAHSNSLSCVMKAKAFWWMMARLAGWDGN